MTVDGLDPQVKDDLLKQLTEDLEGFCIQKYGTRPLGNENDAQVLGSELNATFGVLYYPPPQESAPTGPVFDEARSEWFESWSAMHTTTTDRVVIQRLPALAGALGRLERRFLTG